MVGPFHNTLSIFLYNVEIPFGLKETTKNQLVTIKKKKKRY